jgi:autotransporter passenger strand-loop-strand repeat protein
MDILMTIVTKANSPYKVSSGQTDTGDVVSSGGTMFVLSGGTAFTTTVNSHGLLTVSAGGTDLGTTLGGSETVGGLSYLATVESGGKVTVASGGTDEALKVSAGGVADLLAGGTLSAALGNFGTVEATAKNALIISATVGNSGTLEALGAGGDLVVSATSVTNAPTGIILADGVDARVDLANVTISGGILKTAGAGAIIRFDSCVVHVPENDTLDGVTVAAGALVDAAGYDEISLSGTIANSGTISLGGSAGAVLLNIQGAVVLSGGKLLSENAANLVSANSDATLTIQSATLAGEGDIGQPGGTDLTLVNSGTVDATIGTSGGELVIETGNVVSNVGTLEATAASAGLLIGDAVDNSGKIAALGAKTYVILNGQSITDTGSGAIVASGASAQIDMTSGASIAGGSLTVSGAGAHIYLDLASISNVTLADAGGAITDVVSDSHADLANNTELDDFILTKGSLLLFDSGSLLTLAGTDVVSGTISADSGATVNFGNTLTLTGGGKVLLGNAELSAILPSTSLTNVNDVIAGAGTIGFNGGLGADLTLMNSGIVDANINSTGSSLALKTGNVISNSGTLEATAIGGLIIDDSVDNSGEIAALGAKAHVLLSGGTATNTGSGTISASGAGAVVELDGATISSGTVKTGAGGSIVADAAVNSISDTTVASGSLLTVTSGGTLYLDDDAIGSAATLKVSSGGELIVSGGTIGAHALIETGSGGTAALVGTVTNSGTLYASAAGSLLEFYLAQVSGGVTEVGNGTAIIEGGETVTFVAGGTGVLELLDEAGLAQSYSGTISGFGQNTHQTIDLTNVASAANVSATFSANAAHTSGVLTVSSGGTVVADIAMAGHYVTANFKLGADSSGDVTITDPPVGGTVHSANLALFANAIATSFVSAAGQGGDAPAETPDTGQQPLLAHSPHA